MSHRGAGQQSSVRSLDVLAFLGQTGRPARAVEISRGLGVPHSTVDKILKALTQHGYVSFDRAAKTYSPTYKLVQTADLIERSFFGQAAFRELMQELRETTGHSVGMFVEVDCWAQCVAAVPGAMYDPVRLGEGARVALVGSAPGNALMSLKPDAAVLERARQAAARQILDLSLHDMKRVVHLMRDVRQRGFSTRRARGVVSIACPAQVGRTLHPVAFRLVAPESSPYDVDDEAIGTWLCRTVMRHLAQAAA